MKMARSHKVLFVSWWMGMPCVRWEAQKRVTVTGKDQEFIWGRDVFPDCSPTLD